MRPGFVPRVTALYVTLFLYIGMQMPFLPVWLTARGVDPALIGIVLAIPMLARMLSVPVFARYVDRRDAIRAAIVLSAWTSVAGHVLLGLSTGTLAIAAAYTVAMLVHTPLLPLTETYAVKGLDARARAYGPVRLWGSAAFVAGNFLGGFLLDAIPARDLIWPIVVAITITAVAASTIEHEPLPKSETANSQSLWRDAGFVAVLVGSGLIQASHSIYYIFSALQWRAEGLSGAAIAALWSLGVVAEILLFAVSGRLNISPTAYILIGAAGAVLRWSAMAADPPALALPFLQMLHALSFGATHLGALTYVARRAPPGKAATALGQLSVAASAAGAAAAALSGVLYSNLGSGAYVVMALASVAGGACALVARRRVIAPV